MKKITLLILVLIMTGCSSVVTKSDVETHKEKASFNNAKNVRIVTDTDTGCKYVIIDEDKYGAKMSPYYGEDGKVQGCGTQE